MDTGTPLLSFLIIGNSSMLISVFYFSSLTKVIADWPPHPTTLPWHKCVINADIKFSILLKMLYNNFKQLKVFFPCWTFYKFYGHWQLKLSIICFCSLILSLFSLLLLPNYNGRLFLDQIYKHKIFSCENRMKNAQLFSPVFYIFLLDLTIKYLILILSITSCLLSLFALYPTPLAGL